MIIEEEENFEKNKNGYKFTEINPIVEKHKIQQYIGNKYLEEVKEGI